MQSDEINSLAEYLSSQSKIESKITANYKSISQIGEVGPIYYTSIKKIHLSHNKIKSLKGIEVFQSLTHFSVGHNCIEDISEFGYINDTLQFLMIEGNPVSRHPNLIPYLLDLFPVLQMIDQTKITTQIKESIRDSYKLSKILIPFIYITEKVIESGQAINLRPLFDKCFQKEYGTSQFVEFILQSSRQIQYQLEHYDQQTLIQIHINMFMQICKLITHDLKDQSFIKFLQMKCINNFKDPSDVNNLMYEFYNLDYPKYEQNSLLGSQGTPKTPFHTFLCRDVDNFPQSDMYQSSEFQDLNISLEEYPIFGCQLNYMKALQLYISNQLQKLYNIRSFSQSKRKQNKEESKQVIEETS